MITEDELKKYLPKYLSEESNHSIFRLDTHVP